MNLAKGQEELKTLLAEERKKKTKKVTGVLNMGRRFHGQTRRTLDFATTSVKETTKMVKARKQLSCKNQRRKRKKKTTLKNNTLRLMTSINISKSV